jgi:CO/xanthine dehydrogenase Mo-binding subunit
MHDSSLASLARDLEPSRRSFLIGATALGSSLVVGFSVKSDVAPDGTKPGANPFAGYVQIAPDDTVTIHSSQMDMGQGIYHGIATLVQEELDADWSKVTVVGGAGNTALYGNIPFGGKIQMTGGTGEIAADYRAAAEKGGEVVAANIGDVDAAFSKAAKVIEARYEFPYLAHAPLEPINAAARMNPDGTLEVWGGHQMPDLYQAVAAKVAGITPDKVILRVMKTGGGFGRRASVDSDIIVEAGRDGESDWMEGAHQGPVDPRG